MLLNRVVSVACSPTESMFVSACVNSQNQGKLLLHDIKSKKLEVIVFSDDQKYYLRPPIKSCSPSLLLQHFNCGFLARGD